MEYDISELQSPGEYGVRAAAVEGTERARLENSLLVQGSISHFFECKSILRHFCIQTGDPLDHSMDAKMPQNTFALNFLTCLPFLFRIAMVL